MGVTVCSLGFTVCTMGYAIYSLGWFTFCTMGWLNVWSLGFTVCSLGFIVCSLIFNVFHWYFMFFTSLSSQKRFHSERSKKICKIFKFYFFYYFHRRSAEDPQKIRKGSARDPQKIRRRSLTLKFVYNFSFTRNENYLQLSRRVKDASELQVVLSANLQLVSKWFSSCSHSCPPVVFL